jgi:hypothetical protein
MTCSTCKQIGHKKTTCGLTVKCKLCNQSGHPASKCTYKIIYKYLKQLPKVLIDIIFDYKTSTEVFDCNNMYFNGQISSHITRTVCLKETVFKSCKTKVVFIINKLSMAEKIPSKIERFTEQKVQLSDLFNCIHDKQWLFCKYPKLWNQFRDKLLEYYIICNWSNASVYHKLLFGTFLNK